MTIHLRLARLAHLNRQIIPFRSTLCPTQAPYRLFWVQSLLARGRQAHSVKLSVISSPGSLAHAAPQELAQLAIKALVSDDEERTEHRLRHPPFLSANHLYAPPSPDHGPFISLLTHAPRIGLSLVRQIVDHAISYYTEGTTNGTTLVSLCFPDGDRVFTWPQTYAWSRGSQSGDFCVTSALMALSKGAKQRVENGESLNTVLGDIVSGSDTPAAYLLIAVDLLKDQWPASRESAIPFVTCPELLCLDRSLVWSEYMVADRIPGHVVRDPVPRAALGRSLVDLLDDYAASGPLELRERLASLFRAAVERIGPYGEHAGLNDPAFMASHALNRLDPSNWKQAPESPPCATVAVEYIAPEVEARHVARLAGQSLPNIDNARMRASIKVAAEDPTQSSSDLATAAVEWARQLPDGSPKHRWVITAAALLLVRDCSDIRSQDEQWARQVFTDLVQSELSPLYESVHTLSMNPPAMAFVGLAQAFKTSPSQADIRSLIDLATRGDCATAYGFAAAADTLHIIDERLPRAVLRAAFASCIRPYDRGRRMSVEDRASLTEKHQRRIRASVEAEQVWLDGLRSEPVWPTFPRQEPRIERGIQIFRDELSPDRNPVPATPPTEYVNCKGAALWLNSASVLFSHTTRPWLSKVASAYASWTAVANGLGLNKYESVDSTVLAEWNDSFSALLAYCLAGMESSELDQFALNHITSLPDRSFVVVCDQFVLHVDREYVTGNLATQQAVHIRSKIIERLITSDEWRRWKAEWMAPEKNLGRLVARLFMHDGWFPTPRCWLRPDGVDLVEPLFPTLRRLVEGGPCIFFSLSMIEVEPRLNHLEFIVAAAAAWLRLFHDSSELWVDYAVGRRICRLIDSICGEKPSVFFGDEDMRKRINDVLVSLTSLGVVEAAVLEETLANAEA